MRGKGFESQSEFPSSGQLNGKGRLTVMMHELKIAYELLLDAKRHKLRIADVVLALQDCSRTPPAPGSSPKILGEWGSEVWDKR